MMIILLVWQEIYIAGKGWPIQGFHSGAFNGLQHLRSLTLSNCGIQNMPPLDPTKHNLELLDLVNNDLVFIAQNFFSGFHHLKVLDLSENGLSRIPDITPLTDTLKRFSIRNNLVLSLETFLSAVMYKFLTRLDFSVNKIGELTPGMISQWPELRYLDIECNFVQTLEDLSGLTRGSVLKVDIENATTSPKRTQLISITQDVIEVLSGGIRNCVWPIMIPTEANLKCHK